MKIVFNSIVVLSIISAALFAAPSGILKDISFCASFDESAKPEYSLGSPVFKPKERNAQIVYTAGKNGKGLLVDKAQNATAVQYYAAGIVDASAGTIAFWVLPSDDSGVIQAFNCEGFIVTTKQNRINFWSYTGDWKNRADTYDPAANNAFFKNEWVHIAVTWDKESGQKIIYINGKKIAFAKGKFPEKPYTPNDSWMNIGGSRPGSGTANDLSGVIDEVAVWKRQLSDDEIATIAANWVPDRNDLLADGDSGTMLKDAAIGYASKNAGDGLYFLDQAVTVLVPITNNTSERNLHAEYQVIDHYGVVVSKSEKDISLPSRNGIMDAFTCQVNKYGMYRIRLILTGDKKEKGKDVATFAVIPKGLSERATRDESFYGTHPKYYGASVRPELWGKDIKKDEYHLDIVCKLGLRWARSHDVLQTTQWYRVEKERGKFDYTISDGVITALKGKDLRMMGSLFATPLWASKNESVHGFHTTEVPPDWNEWERYVRNTVTRYKEYVRVWEVWNEPDAGKKWWGGTPAEYVELLKRSYTVIKSIDPSLEVVGGVISSWINLEAFPTEIFKLGAAKYMDTLSIHWKTKMGDNVMDGIKVFDDFHAYMKKHGPDRPIMNTEGGIWSTSFFSDLDCEGLPPVANRQPPYEQYRDAADNIVKACSIMQSEHVKKYFLYFFRGDGANFAKANLGETYYREMHWDFGAGPFDSAPKPLFIAYAFHAFMLDDMKFSKRLSKDDAVWCFTYANDDHATAVLWAETGMKNIDVTLPLDAAGLTAQNIMLNEKKIQSDGSTITLRLGTEPLYLTGKIDCRKIEAAFENASYDRKLLASMTAKPDVPDAMRSVKGFAQAREARTDGWKNIDIRPFCNMGFYDEKAGDGIGGWTDQGALNNIDGIPTGMQTYYHVPIDIIDPDKNSGRSCIVLQSKETPALPLSAGPIPVNAQAAAIYFTHSCAWAKAGDTIASYAIRYADGSTRDIPIIVNDNTTDWWMKPVSEEKSVPFLVRVKRTSVPGNAQNERFIRIFEWLNPEPAKQIASIEFTSRNGTGIPILLAITARKD
ncbi:MAG: LamG-like jellyroll fold domain-containing protein [Spirochaetota bacterium]